MISSFRGVPSAEFQGAVGLESSNSCVQGWGKEEERMEECLLASACPAAFKGSDKFCSKEIDSLI